MQRERVRVHTLSILRPCRQSGDAVPNKQEANGRQSCICLPPIQRREMADEYEDDDDVDDGECVLCDQRGFLIICGGCNHDFCLDCSGIHNPANVPDGEWYCTQCASPRSSNQHRRQVSSSGGGANGQGRASVPLSSSAGEGARGGAERARRGSRDRTGAGLRAGPSDAIRSMCTSE